MFQKKCANINCNEIMTYKDKYNLAEGIRNNANCKICRKEKLKELYKGGLHRNKTAEEKQKIFNKVTEGRKKYYEDNPQELKNLVQLRKKKRAEVGYEMLSSESNKKKISKGVRNAREKDPSILKRISDSCKKWIKENPKKHLERQLSSKNIYKKHFIVNNIKCQGDSEKAYIEYLTNNNLTLPTKVNKGLKTSLGYYFPDFETKEFYIEIKSSYTYQLLKKDNNKQYLKIVEASKVKPIKLIVIDNRKKILEEKLFN